MKLDISAIPEGGLQQALDAVIRNEGDGKTFSVHASLHIEKFGEKVIVEGTAEGDAALSCSRCLADFIYPLRISFRDEVSPVREFAPEGEHELDRDELDSSYYGDAGIDLEDLLREQVLLALPMKPLCRENCRGFCPECGQDLSDGSCSCSGKGTDPRLDPLKELQGKLKYRKE